MERLLSDAEALVGVRQGDSSAYAAIVAHHQQAAFRVAYLILRDAQAAEDVAQEAFVRAYRELSRFRENDPFRPWLLKIVANLALNEQRSRSRRLGLLERMRGLAVEDQAPPADALLSANEEAAAVSRAMALLKDEERLVLYLRYFIGLGEKEMSIAMSRPAGTVKSRLHRASRRLREIIERDFPELRDQ